MLLMYLQVQFAATQTRLLYEHNARGIWVVSSNPQSISSFEHVLGGLQGSHISSHRSLHCWVIKSDVAPPIKAIVVKIASVSTFLNIFWEYPTVSKIAKLKYFWIKLYCAFSDILILWHYFRHWFDVSHAATYPWFKGYNSIGSRQKISSFRIPLGFKWH